MEIFLVNVFTEGKKVVGKAFLSKKRFLVKSRGFLPWLYKYNQIILESSPIDSRT